MSRLRSNLIWASVALAAWPVVPCRQFAAGCRTATLPDKGVHTAVEHGCCSHDRAGQNPVRSSPQPPAIPCKGTCCDARPFTVSGEKPAFDGHPSATFDSPFEPVDRDPLDGVSARVIFPEGRSKQILHCSWRC